MIHTDNRTGDPIRKVVVAWLRIGLVAAVMLSGLAIVSPAQADHNEVFKLHQRGEILSLTELLGRAQAIHPGQMVEAELDEETLVYEITVYGEDDQYHEMYFDARNGRLLSEHKETEESFRSNHHDDD
ncbi:PepSY domain-containing protein [Guyparkeria sp. 1SP6A2]|nr:PepSY domain-containing protein [Guyparkeria sp. 1SP6A2]